jgi:hypothetical protein
MDYVNTNLILDLKIKEDGSKVAEDCTLKVKRSVYNYYSCALGKKGKILPGSEVIYAFWGRETYFSVIMYSYSLANIIFSWMVIL